MTPAAMPLLPPPSAAPSKPPAAAPPRPPIAVFGPRVLWPFAAQPAAQGDVIQHVQPGQQQILLRHVGDPPGQGQAVAAAQFAADAGRSQPGQQSQQTAFTNAAGSQQTGEAAAGQFQVQSIEQRQPGVDQPRGA